MFVFSKYLFAKLVAGEGQNAQTACSVGGVQFHQLLVVLRRQSSLACHVYNKCDKPPGNRTDQNFGMDGMPLLTTHSTEESRNVARPEDLVNVWPAWINEKVVMLK